MLGLNTSPSPSPLSGGVSAGYCNPVEFFLMRFRASPAWCCSTTREGLRPKDESQIKGGGGGLRPPLPQTSRSFWRAPSLWFAMDGSGLVDGVCTSPMGRDQPGVLGPLGGHLTVDQNTQPTPTSGVPRRGFRKNPLEHLIVST